MKILMAYFENLAGLTGGLEKTLCRLSNELVERGHQVVIVTYDENPGRPYYPLKDEIKVTRQSKKLYQYNKKPASGYPEEIYLIKNCLLQFK